MKKARSRLLRLYTSERVLHFRRKLTEWGRRLSGRRHKVTVFLELDDPYSYLLGHYLADFVTAFDIQIDICLTEAVAGGVRPEPELHAEYALMDCRRLARELGLPFLDKGRSPAVEHRRALLDMLASRESEPAPVYLREVVDTLTAYWRGDAETVARRAEGARAGGGDGMIERNQRLLEKLGHYNVAMLHYGGEWYWGIDRLHYLVERLDALGLRRAPTPELKAIRQAMQLDLPVQPPAAAKSLPPLEFFYSFRSPYSYLAISRMFAIADAFGVELKIRPVLPMVMRGLPVPKAKLRYILLDASREARRLGIDFGNAVDPLGKGIERLLATLRYAASQKRERECLLAGGRAVWAKGIDVASDVGLRKVTARAGLFWPDVCAALEDDSWRRDAENNRADMMASGSWGVPTLRIGDWVCWGQDRDWLVARHLEKLCETEEGILV